MASFREMCFTPAEFATIAKVDRSAIPVLENSGVLKTIKRRVGNVDRKMITLEDMQHYFRVLRTGRRGDQISGPDAPAGATVAEETSFAEEVAAATVSAEQYFAPGTPLHKIQMFYNVKGGTGKSTLTAQYVMRAAMMGLHVLAIDL